MSSHADCEFLPSLLAVAAFCKKNRQHVLTTLPDGPKDTAVTDVLERTYVEPDYLPAVKKARAEKKAKLEATKKKRRLAIARRVGLITKANAAKNPYADVLKPVKLSSSAPKRSAAPPTSGTGQERGRGTPLGSIFSTRPQSAPNPAATRAKMENVD